MAITQTIQFPGATGQASGAAAYLFPIASGSIGDTATATAASVTEHANGKGLYDAVFGPATPGVAAGTYWFVCLDSNNNPIWEDLVNNLAQATGTYPVQEIDPAVAANVATILNNVGMPMQAGTQVAITSNLKKNQALSNFRFVMTDSTNHAPAPGKTVTVTRGIDNGAQAAGTLSAVTEIGNGEYRVDFAAADMNGNVIVLRATAPGCDDLEERIITQP